MSEMTFFIILLSLVWFLIYWLAGGVFFAVVTLLRMGRLRKVRFSCLFSLLALICGVGAAWTGFLQAQGAFRQCLPDASTPAQVLSAIFGCGFFGIFGMFLVWAAVLVFGGFLAMALSRTKTKPWLDIDALEAEEDPVDASKGNYLDMDEDYFQDPHQDG